MTTVDDLLDPTKAGPRRDHLGRYLIAGKAYTRVTTFAGSIDDRHQLEVWQQRMVATGLVNRPDLYAQAAAHHDDRAALNRICDDAIEAAKGSAGANLGTALHAFTQRVDLGETGVVIPEPWDADVAAYLQCLQANGVHVLDGYVEQIVVNHELDIAGTFDRLVRVDGYPLPLIADLKTGSLDHSWAAIAVQLACYANADELYDPVSDECEPIIPIDQRQALVIHLPAGQATCTLYMVDIEAGWKAAQLCRQVRDWRKARDVATPFESTVQERVKWLAARVLRLKDQYPEALDELALGWPLGVPTFQQGGHTAEDLTLIALAVSTVETRYQVPFNDGDPALARPAAGVVQGLEDRLAALPVDLVAEVRRAVPDAPNVRSPRFNVTHAQAIDVALPVAEEAHRLRLETASDVVSTLAGPVPEATAVIHDYCQTDGIRWTAASLTVAEALLAAVEAGHLIFGSDGGQLVLTVTSGEQPLLALYGSKSATVAACKELADMFGVGKPRGIADVVASPVLFALATSAPPTATSESEQAA